MHGYETEELREQHIQALLREREGAERGGDTATVKAVDASLRAFGYKAAAPAKRAERKPRAKAEER